MPTINSREMVDKIIENKGHYEDDPRVVKIVQYNNCFDGRLAYGLIYEGQELNLYDPSPTILNPKVLWEVSHAQKPE